MDAEIIQLALFYAGESFDLRDGALDSRAPWANHLPSEVREFWPRLTVRERALLILTGGHVHELTYL